MAERRRRAFKGRTHDVYECCGKPPESEYGRPRTACPECAALMEDGRQARLRLAAEPMQVYLWTSQAHGWPMFYRSEARIESEVHRAMADAFYRLVNSVVLPAPADTPTTSPRYEVRKLWDGRRQRSALPWPTLLSERGHRHDSWSFVRLVLATPETQAALDELHQRIVAALDRVYLDAKAEGRSLLLGLASGELSMTSFDEALLTSEQRRAGRL